MTVRNDHFIQYLIRVYNWLSGVMKIEIYGLVKYLGPRLHKFIGKVAVKNDEKIKKGLVIRCLTNMIKHTGLQLPTIAG